METNSWNLTRKIDWVLFSVVLICLSRKTANQLFSSKTIVFFCNKISILSFSINFIISWHLEYSRDLRNIEICQKKHFSKLICSKYIFIYRIAVKNSKQFKICLILIHVLNAQHGNFMKIKKYAPNFTKNLFLIISGSTIPMQWNHMNYCAIQNIFNVIHANILAHWTNLKNSNYICSNTNVENMSALGVDLLVQLWKV